MKRVPDYYVEWQKTMPEDKYRRMMDELLEDARPLYIVVLIIGWTLIALALCS